MKKIFVFISIILIIFSINSCNKFLRNDNKNISNNESVITPNKFLNIQDLQNQLHNIAKNDTPSVVFISTQKTITQKYYNPFNDFFNSPWDDNRPHERKFKQSGLGSGVIYKKINNNYYILTNNHVIEDTDTIEIAINKSKTYKGQIIGTDPQVDIAVVKIKTNDDLRVANFGDSNSVEVGDFVAAIGNPFGLSGTMTFGIISAVGRNNIQSDKVSLTDFIQTDAAINPGNSGGPLINILGEVIGINTLIYSQSGGNIGIGFAIPINIAKKTADQLIKKGKVEHGFLGIYYKELTDDDITKLGLTGIKNGMLVSSVIQNSPAEKAGIKPGDVITEINNKVLSSSNDLAVTIGNSSPGTKIKLKIIRDNKSIFINVVLSSNDSINISGKEGSKTIEQYGFELAELNDNYRNKYNIPKNIKGVIIINIIQGSIAQSNNLMEGDLIYRINNKFINNINDIINVLKNKNETNYFFIIRDKNSFLVEM